MNRIEYLKASVQNSMYRKANWIIRMLSEFTDPPGAAAVSEPYMPFREPLGLFFFDKEGVKHKIDGYSNKDGALFTLLTPFPIDSTWLPNIPQPVNTDFGIMLANSLMVYETFGLKMAYINGEVAVDKIEAAISGRLTNDPEEYVNAVLKGDVPTPAPRILTGPIRDSDPIYVHEYLAINKAIELISSVMDLFTVALTKKTILPPPGIKEYKAELMEHPDFKGKLDDPIVLSRFEDLLKKFDAKALADDPSFKKFTSGKILNDSRKKRFLSMGAEGGFNKPGQVTAITNSLSEGIPTEPDKIVAVFNGARAGSYSRGAETVEGGVAAKKMLAAASNYKIIAGDCKSKLGISRKYTKELVNSLRGRTLIFGDKQVKIPIDEDVSKYLGQTLRTRSPMYCRMKGEVICTACAGDALGRYPTGVALPLTEISAAILGARMKAMHTNALTVNDFDLETLFT